MSVKLTQYLLFSDTKILVIYEIMLTLTSTATVHHVSPMERIEVAWVMGIKIDSRRSDRIEIPIQLNPPRISPASCRSDARTKSRSSSAWPRLTPLASGLIG